ncbi:MAG: hypothetical protein U0736_21845 [Gemmataceae bacterium]
MSSRHKASLARRPTGWATTTRRRRPTTCSSRRGDAKAPLPLLLYLSPGPEGSWQAFERLARARNLLYVAPRAAGNDCPPRRRVRIALDALDDVRRQFPVDPDRTYLVLLRRRARRLRHRVRIAGAVRRVIPICASGDLRQEPWLRQRVIDRLSVALLTGATDFNRGEVERLRGPYLTEVGVRSRVWTVAGMGHAIPGERTLTGRCSGSTTA